MVRIAYLVTCVLLVISAFAPWATVAGSLDFTGTDGNAGWTVAIGALIAAGLRVGHPRRARMAVALPVALFVFAAAAVNLSDVSSLASGSGLAEVAWGLQLATFAAAVLVLLILASFVQASRSRSAQPT